MENRKQVLLLILIVCVHSGCFHALNKLDSEETKRNWDAFKIKYNKHYKTQAEEQKRLIVFVENLLQIADHNARYEQGEASYKMGVNQFSDMTGPEFVDNMFMDMLQFKSTDDYFYDYMQSSTASITYETEVTAPPSVDWRTRNVVTEVKNQGTECKSCWAFSVTGAIEGQIAKKTNGSLISLSEQNLLDCLHNASCIKGNDPMDAFNYIKINHGIDNEQVYPYEGKVENCRYNERYRAASIKGVMIFRRDEILLKSAVYQLGPVSAAIYATESFKQYENGVFYDEKCTSKYLNHCVLIVGYGVDKDEGDYWLIKNSWGTTWGEKGYMKLARNRKNHCGITNHTMMPKI